MFAFVLALGTPAWAQDGRDVAASLAEENGWRHHQIQADKFLLTAYSRIDEPANRSLVIYIEGDGYPWKTRTELSDDPTPREARALELAVQDPAPNKVYIARPCQYLDPDDLAACPSDYWSFQRYAPEVVAAINRAITQFVGGTGARHVRLVGYSGGGLIAALITERRGDVEELVTVSANLDHKAWTDLHDISPLEGSLNAADVAVLIQDVPQVHFVGADDDNVTPAVAQSYLARMTDPSNTEIVVVEGMSHNCCWTDVWPLLLNNHLTGVD